MAQAVAAPPKERYIPNGLKFAFGGLAGYVSWFYFKITTCPLSRINVINILLVKVLMPRLFTSL